MTVRWGILSTARIAARVVEGCALAPNASLDAVASRSEGRARDYAQEHGIARAYGSYEALLADPAIDAVYIPLPNSMHVPWTLRALAAGKHVLCEKPLARDPALVTEAFDAAERAGRVLMEAFMWRFHPQTELLTALVPRVGALRYVRATFGFAIDEDVANVRWEASLEGGSLMDVGCYCVSALRLICGAEPEHVSGELVEGGDGVDARFAGLLRFPGDVLATFDCGMDVHRRSGIEVVGSEGTLRIDDPWQAPEPAVVLTHAGASEPEVHTAERVQPYAREVEEFSAAVLGGPPPRLGRADALGQARTIQALYASARRP